MQTNCALITSTSRPLASVNSTTGTGTIARNFAITVCFVSRNWIENFLNPSLHNRSSAAELNLNAPKTTPNNIFSRQSNIFPKQTDHSQTPSGGGGRDRIPSSKKTSINDKKSVQNRLGLTMIYNSGAYWSRRLHSKSHGRALRPLRDSTDKVSFRSADSKNSRG